MKAHPDARGWSIQMFKKFFRDVKVPGGKSLLTGKYKAELTTSGYLNHYAYLNPGGLVVITVRGPTDEAWEFCREQRDEYGLNPDEMVFPWKPGPDRRRVI